MLNLTVNHPDAEFIMEWLYNNLNVIGNEDYLENELLTDLMSKPEIWMLERAISIEYDDCTTLPIDLKLINKTNETTTNQNKRNRR